MTGSVVVSKFVIKALDLFFLSVSVLEMIFIETDESLDPCARNMVCLESSH